MSGLVPLVGGVVPAVRVIDDLQSEVAALEATVAAQTATIEGLEEEIEDLEETLAGAAMWTNVSAKFAELSGDIVTHAGTAAVTGVAWTHDTSGTTLAFNESAQAQGCRGGPSAGLLVEEVFPHIDPALPWAATLLMVPVTPITVDEHWMGVCVTNAPAAGMVGLGSGVGYFVPGLVPFSIGTTSSGGAIFTAAPDMVRAWVGKLSGVDKFRLLTIGNDNALDSGSDLSVPDPQYITLCGGTNDASPDGTALSAKYQVWGLATQLVAGPPA